MIAIVGTFTRIPFAGNPAAVCVLDAAAGEGWMLAVAGELRQPATAFVWGADGNYDLRWFNASGELALCGHATLASAHLLQEMGAAGDRIAFTTKAGKLQARLEGGWIGLRFPPQPTVAADEDGRLVSALRATAVVSVSRSPLDLLVELGDEDAVRDLAPDFEALAEIETRGVIVTAPGSRGSGCDFVSRFFAPRLSINEDAVTGTAHACLGPYWSARTGRAELTGRQLSKRGGEVRVEVRGNDVEVFGQAVTAVLGRLEFRP